MPRTIFANQAKCKWGQTSDFIFSQNMDFGGMKIPASKASPAETGERLRALQGALGMTAREFASALGLDEKNVSKYVRGRVRLPFDVASGIKDRFNASLDWLLHGDRGANPESLNKKLDAWYAKGDEAAERPRRGRPPKNAA